MNKSQNVIGLTIVGNVRLLLPTLKKDANGMREGSVLTKALRSSCLSSHYTQKDAENLFWGEVAWDIIL